MGSTLGNSSSNQSQPISLNLLKQLPWHLVACIQSYDVIFAQPPEEKGGLEPQEGSLEQLEPLEAVSSWFWALILLILSKLSCSKTGQVERACSKSGLWSKYVQGDKRNVFVEEEKVKFKNEKCCRSLPWHEWEKIPAAGFGCQVVCQILTGGSLDHSWLPN